MTITLRHRLLPTALFALGAAYVLVFVVVASCRMSFPFELEWTEGTIVDHVHRVASGQAVYAAPSLDFVATMYTPGYYYVSALFALIVGDGFVALRLVSLLASLATFWLIFAVVRRETRDAYAASLGAFLYAATFRETAGWFDMSRPDSLFLAFLIGSAYRLRSAVLLRDVAVAGLLLAASALAKQTGLLLGAPLVAYAWVVNRRGAMVFAATCAGVLLVVGGYLEWTSAGWFSRYITISTGVERYRIWVDELLVPLPVACLGGVWLARRGATVFADGRRGVLFYACMVAGLVGGSYFVNVQRFTAPNAMMPPFACLAILFGVVFHDTLRSAGHTKSSRALACVHALALLQFVWLAYDPWRLMPTSADAAAGHQLIETIRAVDGPVLVYDRGYLARMAGKPGHLNRMPVSLQTGQAAQDLTALVRHAICDGRYAAVVLTSSEDLAPALAYRYLPAEKILSEADVPRTVTFSMPSPNLIHRRRPSGDVPTAPSACTFPGPS